MHMVENDKFYSMPWVHDESFLHSVASPFHSFVITSGTACLGCAYSTVAYGDARQGVGFEDAHMAASW